MRRSVFASTARKTPPALEGLALNHDDADLVVGRVGKRGGEIKRHVAVLTCKAKDPLSERTRGLDRDARAGGDGQELALYTVKNRRFVMAAVQ